MENQEDGSLAKFLWDDFDKLGEILSEKAEYIYVYTLTDSEGFGLISKGYYSINRIGYFLSEKDIEMTDSIRYW